MMVKSKFYWLYRCLGGYYGVICVLFVHKGLVFVKGVSPLDGSLIVLSLCIVVQPMGSLVPVIVQVLPFCS